jgi:hypothetical protein
LLKIFLGCGERNGETSSRDFYALQDLEAELKSSTFLLLKCPRRILLLFRPPYQHLFIIFLETGVGKEVSKQRKTINSFAHSAVANPQISSACQPANRKPENFKINPQISNYLQNNAQLCLKTVLKVVF